MENRTFTSYLLLGSNVRDRIEHLRNALSSLENHINVISVSSVYETASWGDRSQQAYLNQAVKISTETDAFQLHKTTREIERNMGRANKGNYLPRIIDIDILFFDNEMIKTNELIIPHPRIQIRRFVLTPLNEIAEDHVHPGLRLTIGQLLENCEDQLDVALFEEEK